MAFRETLLFLADPGHGWLRVPLGEIAALGIEAEISPYSFIDGRFAYLEEDCDAGRYLTAREAAGIPPPAIQHRAVAGFDRGRPRFGDLPFTPQFWNDLRRS
jgi:hypothetical protein